MDLGRLRSVELALSPPYPALIGAGAVAALAATMGQTRLALIADERVWGLHGEGVRAALEAAGKRVAPFTFAPGEASKTLPVYGRLLGELARSGFDRGGAVVALGGGVTGDLAGFVAASYLRGIAYYGLPTTLLAMVDSSVGGKTGLNLPEGKNLVGAFWQPRGVALEPAFLRTLPERTFREGAVELYKAGLLADAGIPPAVLNPDFRPDGDPDVLAELIARGLRVKADLVAADETEQGVRAYLNLGHTLGHALEAASAHGLSHGDAVGYGLLYAALLGHGRGFADLRGVGWLIRRSRVVRVAELDSESAPSA